MGCGASSTTARQEVRRRPRCLRPPCPDPSGCVGARRRIRPCSRGRAALLRAAAPFRATRATSSRCPAAVAAAAGGTRAEWARSPATRATPTTQACRQRWPAATCARICLRPLAPPRSGLTQAAGVAQGYPGAMAMRGGGGGGAAFSQHGRGGGGGGGRGPARAAPQVGQQTIKVKNNFRLRKDTLCANPLPPTHRQRFAPNTPARCVFSTGGWSRRRRVRSRSCISVSMQRSMARLRSSGSAWT